MSTLDTATTGSSASRAMRSRAHAKLWAFASLAWTPSRQLVYENLKLLFTVDLWLLIAGAMIIARRALPFRSPPASAAG